jgi:3-deoxy-D-manno-octulosonic-acid transferase
LWPNLFARLAKEKISVFIVNGRISDAAYPKYRLVKGFLKGLFRRVTFFCMQSTLDAERIIQLGAPKEKVVSSGNVKFDNVVDVRQGALSLFGLKEEQFVVVAGSTHPGEEVLMLGAYKTLRQQFPLLRLVLAPRHPERTKEVADSVRMFGYVPVLFSVRGEDFLADNEVLVIDVIGQMMPLYSVATVVFVGKSLTRKGGHNIIEPAVFGKPIVIGPYMDNFKDIAGLFLKNKAVVQVADADGLTSTLRELIADPLKRAAFGGSARAVVEQNRGATQRMINSITERVRL